MLKESNQAQNIAVCGYTWLASQQELMGYFLGQTGLSISDLPDIHQSPEFLGAVLDFILSHDAHVRAFCDAQNLPYDAPLQARAGLPGGEMIHWT